MAFRLARSSVRMAGTIQTGPQAKHFPVMKETMLPKGTYEGKVAFVTGGGTGLGRGMAEKFADLGATVVISSRKLPNLEKAAEEIISRNPSANIIPLACDIRDANAVKDTVNRMQDLTGALPSVVVNNAAGNFISPTERLSSNAFKTIVDIVLLGTANVTLEIGKRLIEAEQGCAFLGITVGYAQSGSGYVTPSAASKAGVEALTKSLAAEWGKYGMRFNVIAPGPIYTEGAFSRLDPQGRIAGEGWKLLPVGRMGEVEEIANLATFLCSDYASWLSGDIIMFDGAKFPHAAGEFNKLDMYSKEQWDQMENMIRTKAKSS